jgi:hypothetical protein
LVAGIRPAHKEEYAVAADRIVMVVTGQGYSRASEIVVPLAGA